MNYLEKARQLSEFYKALSDKRAYIEYQQGDDWKCCLTNSPNMESNLENWRVVPLEPEKKVIDLTGCVKSGIDMEFYRDNKYTVSPLYGVILFPDGLYRYKDKNNELCNRCRVRENYWHTSKNGEWNFPEGLELLILFKSKECHGYMTVITTQYEKMINRDIIGVTVLGPAKGWKYSWMED